jgi:hypothetical protein
MLLGPPVNGAGAQNAHPLPKPLTAAKGGGALPSAQEAAGILQESAKASAASFV